MHLSKQSPATMSVFFSSLHCICPHLLPDWQTEWRLRSVQARGLLGFVHDVRFIAFRCTRLRTVGMMVARYLHRWSNQALRRSTRLERHAEIGYNNFTMAVVLLMSGVKGQNGQKWLGNVNKTTRNLKSMCRVWTRSAPHRYGVTECVGSERSNAKLLSSELSLASLPLSSDWKGDRYWTTNGSFANSFHLLIRRWREIVVVVLLS